MATNTNCTQRYKIELNYWVADMVTKMQSLKQLKSTSEKFYFSKVADCSSASYLIWTITQIQNML